MTRSLVLKTKWLPCLFAMLGLHLPAQSMTLQDYLALPGSPPDARVAYGPAPSQFADLFKPAGNGPYPVVVLLHGGCWAHRFGGLTQTEGLARTLADEGIAVWDVEYRGIDEPGGGYPGTYRDVAAALDKLRAESAALHIDMTRLVAVGHSAGAQLAQWAAARARIAPGSPLFAADPLPIPHVIGLGTLADLHDTAAIERACRVDPDLLTGEPQAGRQDVFADTSPAAMLPSGAQTTLINGELDQVAPKALAAHYASLARRAGNEVRTVVVPNATHYDEISVDSPVFPALNAAIRDALRDRQAAPD